MKEADLVKERRLLEKSQELLVSDRDEMKRKWKEFDFERDAFEDTKRAIKQTSEKLATERDKILNEKTAYEADYDNYL